MTPLSLHASRELTDYKPIFTNLVADFGYSYYHTLLTWCGVLDRTDTHFWEVWLVRRADETIGLCGLYSLDDTTDELWLGWLGILPAERNQGYGGLVLTELAQRARAAGARRLYTYVDVVGQPLPFYYRHGFVRLGTVGDYLHTTGQRFSPQEFEKMEDHVLCKTLIDGI